MFYLACLLAAAPAFLGDEPVIRLGASGFVKEGSSKHPVKTPEDVIGHVTKSESPDITIDVTYKVTATWNNSALTPKESGFEAALFSFHLRDSVENAAQTLTVNGVGLKADDHELRYGSLYRGQTLVVATKVPVKNGKAEFSFRARSHSSGKWRQGEPASRSEEHPFESSKPGEYSAAIVCIANRVVEAKPGASGNRPSYDLWLNSSTGKIFRSPEPYYRPYTGNPDLTPEQKAQARWPVVERLFIRGFGSLPNTIQDAKQGGISRQHLESLADLAFGAKWWQKHGVPSVATLAWQQTGAESWDYPIALVGEPTRVPKGARFQMLGISDTEAQRRRAEGYGIRNGKGSTPQEGLSGISCLPPGDQKHRQVLVFDHFSHVTGIIRVQLGGRTLMRCKVRVRSRDYSGPPNQSLQLIERYGPHEADLLKLLEGPFPSRMRY